MGFPQNQSEAAIQAFGTVQAALEALLAGKGQEKEILYNNSHVGLATVSSSCKLFDGSMLPF